MRLLHMAPADPGPTTTIAVYRYDLSEGESFGAHDHAQHQLSWTPSGVLTAESVGIHWELPPTLALWVPGGTPHDVGARRSARLFNVKLNPDLCASPWDRPTVVAATPLLCALASKLAEADLPSARRRGIEVVFLDELAAVDQQVLGVPMPSDSRVLAVARALLDDPADNRSLREWGRACGASERTLARLFVAETQLSFRTWRTQLRIRSSLADLAAGATTSQAAIKVGYLNVSAFIEAFRRTAGCTPGVYRERCRANDVAPVARRVG